MNVRLYVLQRASAMLMIPLIVGHLAIIFYATRQGLSAADVLGRTRGSIGWALYYTTFVMLASLHGAIGVRAVALEWANIRGRKLELLMWGFGIALAALGLRAVYAVVAP